MDEPYDFQRDVQRRIAAEKKRIADERGISVAELEGAVIEVLNAGEPDTDKEPFMESCEDGDWVNFADYARLKARVAAADKLAEALTPFAFFDPDEPDITSDTTQKAWELRYKDRFKDWIDYGQIEDARTALAAYQATKEQS